MRWVTATDLEQWANRRDAQQQFPLLVRRLINFTTKGLRRANFRTGEGIQLGGWDGLVEADSGDQFVPLGMSGWELGTGKSPNKKANEDYRSRTDAPLSLDPGKASYVQVSLRRWSDKQEWEEAKKAEGSWCDVRALDADNLEAWLDLAPPVEAWLARQLGKLTVGVQSLDDYWIDLSASTTPPLVPALFLRTRERAVEKLRGWLQEPPSPLAIRAESTDEAVAFVAVVVGTLEESQRTEWQSRGVVVEDTRHWRHVAAGPGQGSLVVATGGDQISTARLIQDGNHVILTGSLGAGNVEIIELPRLPAYEFASALEEMGFARGPAARLAQESGRTFAAVRTHLGPVDQQPEWLTLAPKLVPVLLAAGWDEAKDGDQEIVTQIAGISYAELRSVVDQALLLSVPPLRRAGTVWKLSAPSDAWKRVGRFIDDATLKRFRSAFLTVMQMDDPRLDLPAADRWAAELHGKASPYSAALQESLAESLARLAVAQPANVPHVSGSLQSFTNRVVFELLDNANARRWSSVKAVLPTLAEAAPDTLLHALEKALDTEPPVLMPLFEEGGPVPFGSSDHIYLLWALERLSWSPDYLVRASLALAKLAELDPGGRTANRPGASLREIFLPWTRHTSANFSMRLELLRQILKQHPEIGFSLLLDLLPKGFDTTTAPSPPQFREWDYGANEPVLNSDYWKFVEGVGEELLKASPTQERWPETIRHVLGFSPDQQKRIREEIRRWASKAAPDQIQEVSAALRELVTRHRQFPQADWALPAEDIQEYSELFEVLQPLDPSTRFGWLFKDPWVELPEERTEDFRGYDEAVVRYRREAVLSTLESGGLGSLLELARLCGAPAILGQTAGSLLDELDGIRLLDESLGQRDEALREFALGFVSEVAPRRGFEWVFAEVDRARLAGWAAESVTDILCASPPGTETWDKVKELGTASWDWYWKNVQPLPLKKPEEVCFAVTELIRSGRSGTAAYLSWIRPEGIPAHLIIECLEQIASSTTSETEIAQARHAIPSLFERLQKDPEAETDRLIRLEWIYLEIFDHGYRRLPATLYRSLNESPNLFVDLVTLCFRERPRQESTGDEPDVNEDANRAALAAKAWRVLHKWPGIPGLREDGTIHEETLAKWIASARKGLIDVSRSETGEQMIGQMLAHSPEGRDGAWPAEPIRNLIEQLRSEHIETGIDIGHHNRLGVQWRGQGGGQERELADKFLRWSEVVNVRWPRTAALLRRMAEEYRSMAQSWDRRAELNEL